MILNDYLLHNVAEIDTWGDCHKILRVPETVRKHLNHGAQKRCLCAANCELRFVADGPVHVTLFSQQAGEYQVSYGSIMDRGLYPITANPLTVRLPINQELANTSPDLLINDPWSPRVIRVLLPRQEVTVVKVEGENLRPPLPEEMPSLRYLAYGTSITEGGCATRPNLCYAAQTARMLGADLINLGMAGSCHAEPEMFDYIASRDDWDIATLALSVNMMGFEPDEFRKRVGYGVKAVAQAHPDKPVACITLFSNGSDYCKPADSDEAQKTRLFRQILREEVTAAGQANLHLIEGPEILDCIQCLTHDLTHPSDWGMHRMAQNLSQRLKALLPT